MKTITFRGITATPRCGNPAMFDGDDARELRLTINADDWPPCATWFCPGCVSHVTRFGFTVAHALRRLDRDAPTTCQRAKETA